LIKLILRLIYFVLPSSWVTCSRLRYTLYRSSS